MARVPAVVRLFIVVIAGAIARRERLVHGEGAPQGARHRAIARARNPWRSGAALWSMAALAVAPAAAREEFQLPFHEMDDDRNGLVDKEEYMLSLRDMLDKAGHERGSTARKFIYRLGEQLYDACDLDADDMLNANEVEFCEYVAETELHVLSGEEMPSRSAVDTVHGELGLDGAQMLLKDIDFNGDGWIDKSEWDQVFRSSITTFSPLGRGELEKMLADPKVAQEMDRLFAKADGNGDGKLGAREVQFGAFLISGFHVQGLVDALFEMDADGNGEIHKSEIRSLISTLKRPTGASLPEKLLRVFAHVDSDADQCLNRDELESAAAMILMGASG